jgi:hypothetical protein
MPELDGYEARLVLEVVAIELGAEQKSIRLRAAVLGLHERKQALDPRRGCLPTAKSPVHTASLVVFERLDKPPGRVRSHTAGNSASAHLCRPPTTPPAAVRA